MLNDHFKTLQVADAIKFTVISSEKKSLQSSNSYVNLRMRGMSKFLMFILRFFIKYG